MSREREGCIAHSQLGLLQALLNLTTREKESDAGHHIFSLTPPSSFHPSTQIIWVRSVSIICW